MQRRKKTISMGVELETYSIALPEYRICRELLFPKRSIIEKGERFTRDVSIGSEYNSKVFYTIREAYFLLKSGLRKYSQFQDSKDGKDSKKSDVIFPVGGWIDRFAGMHVHLASHKNGISYRDAKELAKRIHDFIPFIIAISGNSPVWREKINSCSSNRLLRGSDKYCKAAPSHKLYKHRFREITYNKGGKKKPPTLELRVCDAGIPEYIAAVLVVLRAVALRWLYKGQSHNKSTHENYLKARENAMRHGPRARLVWTNHWMSTADYVDIFFRKYEEELEKMDIPEDVIRVFKYLKKGWNQADLIRIASERFWKKHRPTWQRQFATRYAPAIEELLNGNSLELFAKRLGVKLPSIERTWLGRKEARW
jgi:gamma-glutamyl:cysteine ligase YbdK (ATP-grasp superfamily)